MWLILGWITHALAQSWFWWVEYQDAKWSNYYDLTTTGEANWWSRGKDGYFSLTKSLTLTIICSVIALILAVLLPGRVEVAGQFAPMITGGVLAGVGAGIWSVVHKNVTEHKGRRTAQLGQLGRLADGEDPSKVLGKATVFSRNNQTYWVVGTFYDFATISSFQIPYGYYEDREGLIEQARLRDQPAINNRLIALSKLSEKVWFDKDRSRLV